MDPIMFRDAANPRVLDSYTGPVQGYPNRTPAWTPADFARHLDAGVMRTSVLAEASWGLTCREIDVESGAAIPRDVPPFLLMREHAGFRFGGVYVDLSSWPGVRAVLEAAGIGNDRCRVRIADWTGHPTHFGPDQLGAGWSSWAHQYLDAGAEDNNAAFEVTHWDHSSLATGRIGQG
jgi:hypothetical protein